MYENINIDPLEAKTRKPKYLLRTRKSWDLGLSKSRTGVQLEGSIIDLKEEETDLKL